ncbi:hypothetical protein BCR44DRAFT_1035342 [Catenaria anguillulae PL171]|uniref:Uncharacterized protein n=1 Tax=Catenaria anguillulae PL171 TaxID=765915 RepID=A0A1Y2HV29_9FUNG|nr:hypothetical protein BCR44DRAFT_1035342 [Catenaria anguillulae PL171]
MQCSAHLSRVSETNTTRLAQELNGTDASSDAVESNSKKRIDLNPSKLTHTIHHELSSCPTSPTAAKTCPNKKRRRRRRTCPTSSSTIPRRTSSSTRISKSSRTITRRICVRWRTMVRARRPRSKGPRKAPRPRSKVPRARKRKRTRRRNMALERIRVTASPSDGIANFGRRRRSRWIRQERKPAEVKCKPHVLIHVLKL